MNVEYCFLVGRDDNAKVLGKESLLMAINPD
jgi:hypothetical protein